MFHPNLGKGERRCVKTGSPGEGFGGEWFLKSAALLRGQPALFSGARKSYLQLADASVCSSELRPKSTGFAWEFYAMRVW